MLLLWSLRALPSWGGGLLICVVLFSLGNGTIVQQSQVTKDDWRGVSQYIQMRYQSTDLIFANPAASKLALDYYLERNLPIRGYPETYTIVTGGWSGTQITEDMVDGLLRPIDREYDRIWLVEFYPQFWDPNQYLEQWLTANTMIVDSQQFGGIRIRLFQF